MTPDPPRPPIESGTPIERRPPIERRAQIKICGLTRASDALAADRAGADYLGVVLTSGFGRSVTPEGASAVLDGTDATRVAVLVDETPVGAAALAATIAADVLQLHGSEGRSTLEALRSLGEWRLWKAVRTRAVDDIKRTIDDVGDMVDGVLVEGWRHGVVGGAGLRLALTPEEVRDAIPESLPFILAGGLEPQTVGEAMARFAPDVVDVSSGVERTLGVKDPDLIAAFIDSVRP